MKKKYIIAIIVGVLLLAGLILLFTLGNKKGKTEKDNTQKNIIVHESDEDTVEEKAEGGLKESDSEDGPVLNEDNMIDFNGDNAQSEDQKKREDSQGVDNNNPSDGTENDGDGEGDSTTEEPSEDEEEKEDSKDTGAWGTFY